MMALTLQSSVSSLLLVTRNKLSFKLDPTNQRGSWSDLAAEYQDQGVLDDDDLAFLSLQTRPTEALIKRLGNQPSNKIEGLRNNLIKIKKLEAVAILDALITPTPPSPESTSSAPVTSVSSSATVSTSSTSVSSTSIENQIWTILKSIKPPSIKPPSIPLFTDIAWNDTTKEQLKVVLLLHVVNENEMAAMCSKLNVIEGGPYDGKRVKCTLLGANMAAPSIVRIGQIGNARVALVQSGPGADGAQGAIAVVGPALDTLHPKCGVIGVGVCFGRDITKQKFGDVIVGNQMIEYGHVRNSGENNIQHRGVITASGTRLFLQFKGQAFGWNNQNKPIEPYQTKAEEISELSEFLEENPSVKVFEGPILSGPELIDNPARAKELFDRHPTAVAGEMEGIGLYTVAQTRGVEWIVIKGICDFARDKAKGWQRLAAENAAQFVVDVVKSPDFVQACIGNHSDSKTA